MIDLSTDEGVRAAFQEIASWTPDPASEPAISLAERRTIRRSRRSILVGVAASVVLVAVLVTVLVVGNRSRPSVPAATGTWTVMASSPLASRLQPAVVWDGEEMLVWGGVTQQGTPLVDGAAYSPATNSWRPISEIPAVQGAVTAVQGAVTVQLRPDLAVWTGSEVVTVLGRSDGSGFDWDLATYRPDDDTWTTVDRNRYEQLPTDALRPLAGDSPLHSPTAMVAWRGLAVVYGWNSQLQRSGWATFDPAAGAWSAFHPVNDDYASGGFAGTWSLLDDRWLVLIELEPPMNPNVGVTVVDLDTEASYHLAFPSGLNGSRASIPRIDSSGLVVGAVLRQGADAFSTRAVAAAAVLDPTARSWRVVTPPPGLCDLINEANHPELAALPDGHVIIGCVDEPVAAVSDESVAHWVPLVGMPVRVDRALQTMIWTGSELIVWGGAVADPGSSVNQPAVPLDDGAVLRYPPSMAVTP